MKKSLMLISMAFLLCFTFSCQKGEKNATGTFTFNNKITKINYVYAWYGPSVLDRSEKNIYLVFSDNPIPDKTHSLFDLQDLGEKGKIHGLMVRYSTMGTFKDSIEGGNFFHEDIGHSSLAYSAGFIEVELTNYDENVMEGRIFTKEPRDIFDHKYELDVSYKVSLPTK